LIDARDEGGPDDWIRTECIEQVGSQPHFFRRAVVHRVWLQVFYGGRAESSAMEEEALEATVFVLSEGC